jgi:hypothetical protein
MDLGNAILWASILAICIAPFVIIHYNNTKRKNSMLQSLNEIAQQHKCSISKHEFCGDFVLGLDEDKNFVFFLKKSKTELISQFVDLAVIQACHAVKKTRTIKKQHETLVITERVELCFVPANKAKHEVRFELFDEDTNIQLTGELQFVDDWSIQLNNRLKSKKA